MFQHIPPLKGVAYCILSGARAPLWKIQNIPKIQKWIFEHTSSICKWGTPLFSQKLIHICISVRKKIQKYTSRWVLSQIHIRPFTFLVSSKKNQINHFFNTPKSTISQISVQNFLLHSIQVLYRSLSNIHSI